MEQFDVLVPLWLTKVTYKQVVYGACFRTAVCLCVWCESSVCLCVCCESRLCLCVCCDSMPLCACALHIIVHSGINPSCGVKNLSVEGERNSLDR